jgi:hypothetical protein
MDHVSFCALIRRVNYEYNNVFAALEISINRSILSSPYADELLRKYYWFAVLPQVRVWETLI